MPANGSVNGPLAGRVCSGDLIWTPSADRIANANITAFMAWLKQTRGLDFDG